MTTARDHFKDAFCEVTYNPELNQFVARESGNTGCAGFGDTPGRALVDLEEQVEERLKTEQE